MAETPGYVDGKHFTEYVDRVKELRQHGENDRAEALLLKLVEATEAESSVEGDGVAPWYYEQLAIMFRKADRLDDEIRILERFAAQKHARGSSPPKLLSRLEKARQRFNRGVPRVLAYDCGDQGHQPEPSRQKCTGSSRDFPVGSMGGRKARRAHTKEDTSCSRSATDHCRVLNTGDSSPL